MGVVDLPLEIPAVGMGVTAILLLTVSILLVSVGSVLILIAK